MLALKTLIFLPIYYHNIEAKYSLDNFHDSVLLCGVFCRSVEIDLVLDLISSAKIVLAFLHCDNHAME